MIKLVIGANEYKITFDSKGYYWNGLKARSFTQLAKKMSWAVKRA